MSTLKKLFPLSWKYSNGIGNLIVGIIIHIIAEILIGALITLATMLTGWIPVIGALVGWALGIVSSLLGLYILIGIILQILLFLNVLKN